MVFVLLIAAIGGPMAAPAAATHNCSTMDAIIFGLSLFTINQNCADTHVDEIIDQFQEVDTNETKAEIYDAAYEVKTGNEQIRALMSNYLNDSRTVAMAKGEAAAIAALDSGANLTEAQAAANESIEDYYSLRQMTLADRWSTAALQIESLINVRKQNNISRDFIWLTHDRWSPSNAMIDGVDDAHTFEGARSTTVTLVNGSTYSVYEIGFTGNGNDPDDFENVTIWWTVNSGEEHSGYSNPEPDTYYTKVAGTEITVQPVEGQTSFYAIDFIRFKNNFEEPVQKAAFVKDNMAVYVETLYNAKQNGTLDAAAHVNPYTLAQEYATDYQSTGYYSYAIGMAASMGMSVPDVGNLSVMVVEHDGKLNEGLLFSQNAPDNDTWVTGQTYNPDYIEGKQFFATVDGEVIELTKPFVIKSMENKQGEQVSSTTSQTYVYYSGVNTTEYAELQAELTSLRQEIESLEPTVSNPGTTGDGGDTTIFDNLSPTAILAIAAVAVVVLTRR